jgi:hypothetical protein
MRATSELLEVGRRGGAAMAEDTNNPDAGYN